MTVVLAASLAWGRCVACPAPAAKTGPDHSCCDPQPQQSDCPDHPGQSQAAMLCGETAATLDSAQSVQPALAVGVFDLEAVAEPVPPRQESRTLEPGPSASPPDLLSLHSILLL